jgi:GntR family transcriptional regulator/MocR family aminotransferase
MYQQIYQAIRSKILDGELSQNTMLPPSRVLAGEMRVSRNIVLIAYEMLISEGYLVTHKGSGTYVASIPDAYTASARTPTLRRSRASIVPRLSEYAKNLGNVLPEPPYRVGVPRVNARYDFRHGHPPIDLLSQKIWRRIVSRRASSFSRDEVSYSPPEGVPALREAVAQYLCDRRGVECDSSQIVIVNGSQQALDLVARVLVNPGDAVVVEEPCYPGTRQSLVGIGANIHAVRVDGEGLVTDELSSIRQPVRLVCVTPSHQYPTGNVMPLARRLELIAFARRVGAFIVEDDYDSEFRYDARPEKSVQGLDSDGRVVYIGTFSKVLFPALRLGYVALPKPLIEPFIVAKSVADRYAATFFQGVVAEFIREGHFERHLRRVRVQVGERRNALIEALSVAFEGMAKIEGENAGVHLLAWFPGFVRNALFEGIRRAFDHGVAVYSVDPCYLSPPRAAGLMMGYACMPPKEIREGVRRFAEAMKAVGKTSGTMDRVATGSRSSPPSAARFRHAL